MTQLQLLLFCRIVIGLVFLLSFSGKMRAVPTFEQSIASFNLLPTPLIRVAALALLVSEFLAMVLVLVGGEFLQTGFILATVLLLLFSIALATVHARKIRTTCNCFGKSTKPVTAYDQWRNGGFIVCALVGWSNTNLVSEYAPPSLELAEAILIGLVAVVFVVACTHISHIAQMLRQG